MGHPWTKRWTWTLCFLLVGIWGTEAIPRPQYMVAIPAVLKAGHVEKYCASLVNPHEEVEMDIYHVTPEGDKLSFSYASSKDFHLCTEFMAPLKNNEVLSLKVEVKSPTFSSTEIRKVLIKTYNPVTFVQTDKPIYLPGQTVNFRVVSLDLKLNPVSQMYNIIEIEDPHSNRIGQWLNETSDGKILQRSYSLTSEAREGSYQIIVSVGEEKYYHNFKVEKYVLPKFDVTLKVKEEMSIAQEETEAEVCAKYTYGQSVPGTVEFKACRPISRYITRHYDSSDDDVELDITAPCHTESKQTDKNGCATFTLKTSTFTKIDQKAVQDVLDVVVKVEEEGTGVSRSQLGKIGLSYVVGKISFIDTPKVYDKGLNLEGKVKALDYDNKPIAGMPLYLFMGERWASERLQNLTTDSEGVAAFTLNTTNFNGNVRLQVSDKPILEYPPYRMPFYESEGQTVSMNQPSSPDIKVVSSLAVTRRDEALACDTDVEIPIKYIVAGEPQGAVDLIYLVLSRGAIISQGFEKFEVKEQEVNEGQKSLKLKVTPDMSPDIQVVAYAILPSENVIANSADFSIEKCFRHKVSLDFTPSSAVPGEEANMQLTALPNSVCGVSAVDQSVLVKEPGKTLEAETIYGLLPVKKSTYIPYEAVDATECLHVRPRRYILPYPPDSREDAFSVFQNVGLKMVTNLFIQVPSCLKFKGREYHQGHGGYGLRYSVQPERVVAMASPGVGSAMDYAAPLSPVIETVRTFFPETWIWDLFEVGDSGKKDVSLKVPDTITTWETEAFCLSPQGFGLAPRQKLTVFQPFFLELTMPYSVIRGESFELKATTFNYLSNCIMMTVTPEASTDYELTPLSGDKYTACLCGNERKTVSWTMAPRTLGVVNVTVSAQAVPSQLSCDNEVVSVPERGRVDVVTKSLIVKAEGTEVTQTANWLLCPKNGVLNEETDINLPADVIDGSARASVSVLGDILGRAMKNLDGMLQMPFGCGEQNMALLAPNIYILEYLMNTQQLTPAIKERAINFLNAGYQRQMNYKHGDGAYSTFGSGSGNTWLTAFVVRSFAKARSFIFIDPTIIEQSTGWLQTKQRENGCFEKIGKLFNNRMKGGVSDEVTLSAYITAAILEMNKTAENPVVKKSLMCLKESLSDLSNTYTTALLAYVFTLAGDMETRGRLLQHLDNVAIRQGGFLHWSQKASETSTSLSVEISSYVMMAKLSASPTAEDLGYTSSIVRWLTSQQNYYGGFSSTQDTVAALQALALYSTLVFSPDGSSTVVVQTPSGKQEFEVNPNNKLLYQEAWLQNVAGKYSLEVKGSACAAVQISLHFNIPTPAASSTLSVAAKVHVDNSKPERPKVTLKLRSLYNGTESTTNMVILDIKMLSGFVPDSESLKMLRGALLVDRVDRKEDHVLVYLRELPKDIPINHTLDLVQEIPVQNLKPAVVKIYDYYQPSKHL